MYSPGKLQAPGPYPNTSQGDFTMTEEKPPYVATSDEQTQPIECQFCKARFENQDAYQIHLGIGAPAFHPCNDSHEMQVKGMHNNRPDKAWCIPPVFVTHSNNWAYLNKEELKRYIDAVKKAAKQYWSTGNEPVKIVDVWVYGTSSYEGIEQVNINVSWESESTRDELRDDMLYSVSVLDDGSLDVDGPEW
jgi:hypothetical protein